MSSNPERVKNSLTLIHVPPIGEGVCVGELKNILIGGIMQHTRTRLCADIDQSDYVFLDFRHLDNPAFTVTHPEKTIIIDYRDQQHAVFPHPALLYFKRSVINRSTGDFQEVARPVIPISYCVRNGYFRMHTDFHANRPIDIAVFFDPDDTRNVYRASLAQFIQKTFPDLNTFVGIAGKDGYMGRNQFQVEYFELMQQSKIIVTCNPDRWEGDYRLFEAVSSGALVFCDKMKTPVLNPFLDGVHLVYYDRNEINSIESTARHWLKNAAQRERIAQNAYEHAMTYHTTAARIDEILESARAAQCVAPN